MSKIFSETTSPTNKSLLNLSCLKRTGTRWSPWGQPGSATGRVPMLSLTQILRGIHLAEFGLQSKFLFWLPVLVSQVLAWWQNIKWAFLLCGMSVVAGISDPFGLYLKRKKKKERKKERRKKKEELTCSFWSTAAGSESRAVPGTKKLPVLYLNLKIPRN